MTISDFTGAVANECSTASPMNAIEFDAMNNSLLYSDKGFQRHVEQVAVIDHVGIHRVASWSNGAAK